MEESNVLGVAILAKELAQKMIASFCGICSNQLI
jgi:hypothetical protein